ncbi:sigma-70 family RNA polymerase sigma factor [Anaerolentibacter hominis]|uniref:sigma-70 family RNA polymerase sigma factor n=1 Tax=Anaerolentibacter hominis TaxID=3079009 RepID=UPI0031B81ED5
MSISHTRALVEQEILKNYQALYRLAFSYVKNEPDAMDILQESVYKAIRSSDSIRNPAYIKTWLWRLVINTAFDFLRKQNKEDLGIEDDQNITEDAYMDFDTRRALDTLEPKEKTVVILRYFEDRKLSEIAEIMQENLNSVKTILYRSLKKLRIQLEEPV